jgi:hypothetical protein
MASLEERIAAQLNAVLDHQERGGFSAPDADRGLSIGGPDAPRIVLTVEDVARIAARVASQPAGEHGPRMTGDEMRAKMAEMGMVSTPETREWARRVLADAKERRSRTDYVGIRRAIAERSRRQFGE